jgi:uncharacterized membrane protein (UPF0127 family)
MKPLGRLINAASGQVVVARLYVADRFLARLIGLQFRRPLPAGEALLLAPCRSIHTCWLRFPLDLVCLDAQGTVVQTRQGVRPWRIVRGHPRTFGILEASMGQLQRVRVGDRLRYLPGSPSARIPRRLRFLA